MYSAWDDTEVTHGFLIVKTYARLYLEFANRYRLKKDIYAIPRADRAADESSTQYRGLDRDALSDHKDSDLAAEIRMAELRRERKCSEGLIFARSDTEELLHMLPNPELFEVIWTREICCTEQAPEGFVSAGFEATYFLGDHFSASCDCMLFPRWHGTDEQGKLFLNHFRKLNRFGLFDMPDDASSFLDYYLSFDWTETGDYAIAEVFICG